MIIKTLNIANIGDIITDGVLNINGERHRVPFCIIREATLEEYLESIKEEGYAPGEILTNDKFYEISIG